MYPSSPENTHLKTIPHMKDLFQCQVGLSDHTLGIGVAVASVALGATVIEKHFTLARAEGGVDATFSMEPKEMEALVIETKRAWLALGKVYYGPTNAEKMSLKFKRSLYVSNDMKKGDVFTTNNVRIIRPGYDLAPKYYDRILGKQVNEDVIKGMPLSWDLI